MRIDLIPDTPQESKDAKKKIIISSPTHKHVRIRTRKVEKSALDSPFRSLLQSIYDIAIITTTTGDIVDINVRAVEKLSYEAEDLCALSILNIVTGSDDTLLANLLENLENDRFTIIQASCVRGDGSVFPAEISVNKIDLGEVHLCFLLRDITVRVQREEMLRTTYSAIQNAGNGIAVSNLDGTLEYVNPALAEMWQVADAEELLGVDARDLFEDSAEVGEAIEMINNGEQALMAELAAARADGTSLEIQMSMAVNRNNDGEAVGIIFSFVDMSDRARAIEAERDAEQRRVMLESLGAACHHLGQPATVLMGNLGIMQKKLEDADEMTKELIANSIEAMETMSDILYRLNTVNEYKTTQYLEKPPGSDSEESRILEI